MIHYKNNLRTMNYSRPARAVIVIAFFSALMASPGMTFAADTSVPSANDASVSTLIATPATFTLSGSSNDGGAVTFATTTNPTHGTLGTITDVGSVIYIPDNGFTGADTFQFITTEGATSSSFATVTITVAPLPVSITYEVYTADATLFSGPLSVAACPEAPGSAVSTVNGFCAFAAAGLAVDAPWNAAYRAHFVNGIGGVGSDTVNYWSWFLNGDSAQVGIDGYLLAPNDHILWTIGRQPLKVSISTTSPAVGATTTVHVLGFDTNAYDFVPMAGASLVGATGTTDASGNVDILATSTNSFIVSISASGFITSASITVTPTAAPASPAPVSTPSSGGGGGGSGSYIIHSQLSTPQALAYLTEKQNTDGSFGSALLSDWAAVAYASADVSAAKTSLRNYMLSAVPDLSSATDYERHAMALEALSIDPYSGANKNYIAPIVSAFDGAQIGDAALDNDDIFALFPLLHAGYTPDDVIIRATTAFIVSRQLPNGSWDGTVDLTAAAVQALASVPSLPGVPSALVNARVYLHAQQKNDGGFGNSFSTSWALQAVAALGESPSNWAPSGYTPLDYLAGLQQQDGGIDAVLASADMRVWATAYAIPASLGKTWDSLLASFPKPSSGGAAGGSSNSSLLSAIATSTLSVATSTPLALTATSTQFAATSTTPSLVASSTPAHLVADVQKPQPPSASVLATIPVRAQKTQTVASNLAAVGLSQPAPPAVPSASDRSVLTGGFISGILGFFGNFFRSLF